jgi:hypothetical protein
VKFFFFTLSNNDVTSPTLHMNLSHAGNARNSSNLR